ncbi:TlpA family protein disulfide reductase, partial [bacterium]|nr:TlpA family protein disulfide reductase [bacterium]
SSQTESWVGQKAPLFSLKEASTSKDIALSDLIGKKVIYITWWGTWCPACIEEIPELTRLYSKMKDKGLEIIAIDLKDSQEKVAKFVKLKNIPYPNVLDHDGSVSQLYKVVGIPINVVIDSKGVIQYYGSTIPDNAEKLITKLVGELVPDNPNDPIENKEHAENIVSEKQNYTKAPDFSLKDINGNEVRLSSYKDKVVILSFWATWCPPCRLEIPHLIDIQNTYGSKGVQIIGISIDHTGIESVKSFVEVNGINYPVLMSNSQVVAAYNGTANISIPKTFIIDKQGSIRESVVGLRDKLFFESIITKLL